jgi:WD40 repeat protein
VREFGFQYFPIRLATNEATKPAAKTYTTCHIASVSIELTDASFLWKTKDTTKQYASNVRFLGTESTFLLSIENESLAYDAENCILTSLFQGHTDKINAVAFNSSLDVCFTASSDKFVKAWDISRAPKFDLLEHSSLAAITTIVIGHQQSDLFNDFMDCTFFFGCSDGSLGANKCHKRSASESLTSTDYSLSGVFYKHSYGISALAYFRSYKASFPDTVASCDMNGGIMLWNASERKFLRALINTRSITIVASHFFLPAAAAGEETHLNLFTITGDGFCVVWDAENGSAIRFVNLPVSTVSHVQLCTDCFFCVLRHTGVNAFTLFDYTTLANLGLLKPQLFTSENETLTALTLSIGGERCAVGSSTGDICLFEPHSQHMVLVGKHHKKEVNILLWTRFMNRVVSTAADMTLAIWDGFSTPNGSESEFSHGGFPVFAPIVFNKLDANLTIIQECANVPCKTAVFLCAVSYNYKI